MSTEASASPRGGLVMPRGPLDRVAREATAAEALAQARDDINEAREASMHADSWRQAQCARSVIASATTILVDPGATRREVAAAHSVLREALALDGRPNTCGAESIDTLGEASALSAEDQNWLENYLASRTPTIQQYRHFPNPVHRPTSLSLHALMHPLAKLRGKRS